jgi:hypothetical protein
MDDLLKDLLDRLGLVGQNHEEIYDTECRDRMSTAVFDGFIRQLDDFVLPPEFGLYSPGANESVREALAIYINEANVRAAALHLISFHDRLSAFQNSQIKSTNRGDYFDDLFGYSDPKAFNAEGDIVEMS